MPAIKVSIPHQLGADEAKSRISNLVTEGKSKFGASVSDVNEVWTGNTNRFSFRAMGMAVSGTLQVHPNTVDVQIDLPFAALPFKSRIENELATKARALLSA